MKKGFTLIELLATIIILAIIVVIVVPKILNITSESKEEAIIQSALGYLDAVEKQSTTNMLDDDKLNDIKEGTYQVSELEDKGVEVKGEKVTSGYVVINEDGETSDYYLVIGKYVVTPKNGNPDKPTALLRSKIQKVYNLADLVQYDPVANASCDSGDTCYKWRVITTNDTLANTKITLQMDHNIVNKSAWAPENNNSGPITALTALETATASWNDALKLNYTYDTSVATNNYGVLRCVDGTCTIGDSTEPVVTNLKARMITGEEFTEITRTEAEDVSWTLAALESEYYYFSHPSKKLGTRLAGEGNNNLAWTLENTVANSTSQSTANTYGDTNNGYWTLSPISDRSDYAWRVGRSGNLSVEYVYNTSPIGIRPVIEVSKSKIN